MEQISHQVAKLVAERQKRGAPLEVLAQAADADVAVLQNVERLGVRAPLVDIGEYARALGFETSLMCHADEVLARREHLTCDVCGGVPRYHAQRHSVLLGACVDDGIANLWLALAGVGVSVEGGCEGFPDNRRGGEAHLTFPTLADARAFYALVDRLAGEIPWRAGLRGSRTGVGAWTSAVSWEMLPGDLLADARVVVRFPHGDIAELTRLAAKPPRAPLAELAMRRENVEDR